MFLVFIAWGWRFAVGYLSFTDWHQFSSGYFSGSCNFAVKNLREKDSKAPKAIETLIALQERGLPTKPSGYLLYNLGEFVSAIDPIDFHQSLSLLGPQDLYWGQVILGDSKNDYYPARTFLYEQIDKHLPEYRFIKNLILPECPISWILQGLHDVRNINSMERVDFFLPEANLVIEVDGQFHNKEKQKQRDIVRDVLLKTNNITVIRIPTTAIAEEGEALKNKFSKIRECLVSAKALILPFDHFLTNKAYANENITHDLVAISRMQRVLSELICSGQLPIKKSLWTIEITSDFPSSFDWPKLAIEDFFYTLDALFTLYREPSKIPDFKIIASGNNKGEKPDIRLDLALFKRFDESCLDPEVVYIRNDFVHSRSVIANKIETSARFDHSNVARTIGSDKEVNVFGRDAEHALLKLAYQIFSYKEFNPGQVDIIRTHFSFKAVLGLLPTGAGKSFCFQLSTVMRRGCSLVVCPITALVRDHVAELEDFGFKGRASYISAEVKSERRLQTLAQLKQGRLRFLFVSPEQLQRAEFRSVIRNVAEAGILSSIVVDEVHCLSEWGHDFRTSYLTLGQTIRKFTPNAPTLCLTATASERVLKNIAIEMNVTDEAICYHMDSSRDELNFIVEKSKDARNDLKKLIRKSNQNSQVDNTAPFIIFTPYRTNDYGCSWIISDIRKILADQKVALFCGTMPNPEKTTWSLQNEPSYLPDIRWGAFDQLPAEEKFGFYKAEVQRLFKQNKIAGICATKSFGMGVNKKNVRMTVHLGCPPSMESLYQEGGRAGRDKQPADCIVIFTPEKELPEHVSNQDTSLNQLNDWQKSVRKKDAGDFTRQLFMLTKDLKNIKQEVKDCQLLISFLRVNSHPVQIVKGHRGEGDGVNEKTIYRLYQLGFIKDWTVDDFYRGIFSVEWQEQNPTGLVEQLEHYISKYADSLEDAAKHKKAIRKIMREPSDNVLIEEKLIGYLLQWNYDHFVYNRRQSLKTIYDECNKYSEKNKFEFKKNLESYFSVNMKNRMEVVLGVTLIEAPQQLRSFLVDEDGILKAQEEIRNTGASIARYLESYQNNPGLNLLSAFCRAALGEFDDSDGRNRFKNYISQALENGSINTVWPDLKEAIEILPDNTQKLIATELLQFDIHLDLEVDLFETFGITAAAEKVVGRMNQQLEKIV